MNLLLYKQILSFKSSLGFAKTILSREANRKSFKLIPFIEMVRKHKSEAYILTLLHSEWPKLYGVLAILIRVLAILSAKGLRSLTVY